MVLVKPEKLSGAILGMSLGDFFPSSVLKALKEALRASLRAFICSLPFVKHFSQFNL